MSQENVEIVRRAIDAFNRQDFTRIVSVTHAGDAVCRASNTNARLDTDTARAFLSEFIQVP